MNLDAKCSTIEAAFKDFKKIVIPGFQRDYAWGPDAAKDLLNDLQNNAEGYFLGPMIHLDRRDQEATIEVVDGQQRTLTIYLILLAFLKIASKRTISENEEYSVDKAYKLEKLFRAIESRCEPLIYKDESFFSEQFSENLVALRPLSLDTSDALGISTQSVFNTLVSMIMFRVGELSEQSKETDFYKNFILIEDYLQSMSYEQLCDFMRKLLSAKVILETVTNYRDAFILFETQNYRGKPLVSIDIIKNIVYQTHFQTSDSYDFSEINAKWQLFSGNLVEFYKNKSGAKTKSLHEVFLKYFYWANSHNTLFNDTIGQVELSNNNVIRNYTNAISKAGLPLFELMIEKSFIFSSIINPDRILRSDKFYPFKRSLINLKVLKNLHSSILLMYLLDAYDGSRSSKEAILRIMKLLEHWTYRIRVADLNTGFMEKLFVGLVNKAKTLNLDDLFDYLSAELPSKSNYPTDDEIITKMLMREHYGSNRTDLTAYIFSEIENLDRTSGAKIDFTDNHTDYGNWSIEHVLPQTMRAESVWSQWFTADEHKRYLNKIGNLTFSDENQALSNLEFEQKKLRGFNESTLLLDAYIKEQDVWNADKIDERGRLLIAKALYVISQNLGNQDQSKDVEYYYQKVLFVQENLA